MTLASQNIRNESRHRHMSARRPLVSPKVVGVALAAGVVVLTAWWLLRAPVAPGQGEGDRTPAENSSAGASQPERSSPQPPAIAPSVVPPVAPTVVAEQPTPKAIVMGGHVDLAAASSGTGSADTHVDLGTRPSATGAGGGDGNASLPPGPAGGPAGGGRETTSDRDGRRSAREAAPSTNDSSRQGRDAPTEQSPGNPQLASDRVRDSRALGVTTNADLAEALRWQESDPVRARLLATRAIDGGTLSQPERARAYELINAIGRAVFLNANVNPQDPTIDVYTVQPGDNLQRIVRDQKLACDYRLLQRLNELADPNRLRVKQRLRIPNGAFHAEVNKREYRLNLYLGEGSDRVIVLSFPVGLGESDGTPTGLFKVRPNSKLIDPEWTHPRTGQHFASRDPLNPIGEHWIGLVGVEDANREYLGYGIHGTIEPASIGNDRSLGCVRMLPDDVAIVYECLTEPDSTVLIR